jgi:hypothetical protein
MRKSITIMAVVLMVLCIGFVYAQEKTSGKTEKKSASKETTVSGEVVDVSCYLAEGEKGRGSDHKGCAEACAKAGGPLGILTKSGKLYVSILPDDHSTGPNAKLMDYVAQDVKATGVIRSKGGVNGIMITSVTPGGEKK